MNTVRTQIVNGNSAIKSWRAKGIGDHMPWFSEDLMDSVEETLEKVHDDGEKVDAYLIDNGKENNWIIEVKSVDRESYGEITLERTEPCVKPNISIKVNNCGEEYRLVSDSVERCFSDTLALMTFSSN